MDKNDLISRSEAIRELGGFDDDGRIRDLLDDLPAIDPEELRPEGKWVYEEQTINSLSRLKCSNCNWWTLDPSVDGVYHYCPNCGAMMEG